jgi:hypothetical protein
MKLIRVYFLVGVVVRRDIERVKRPLQQIRHGA